MLTLLVVGSTNTAYLMHYKRGNFVGLSALLHCTAITNKHMRIFQRMRRGFCASVHSFINGLLNDVEEAGLGMEISNGKSMGGMSFADDFVGVSESRETLQKLIDVVYRYCNRWRLKANVGKSAVMVFSKDRVEGKWKWENMSFLRFQVTVI